MLISKSCHNDNHKMKETYLPVDIQKQWHGVSNGKPAYFRLNALQRIGLSDGDLFLEYRGMCFYDMKQALSYWEEARLTSDKVKGMK